MFDSAKLRERVAGTKTSNLISDTWGRKSKLRPLKGCRDYPRGPPRVLTVSSAATLATYYGLHVSWGCPSQPSPPLRPTPRALGVSAVTTLWTTRTRTPRGPPRTPPGRAALVARVVLAAKEIPSYEGDRTPAPPCTQPCYCLGHTYLIKYFVLTSGAGPKSLLPPGAGGTP